MILSTNKSEIRGWMKDKEALELDLAKTLTAMFESTPIIEVLRVWVRQALEAMEDAPEAVRWQAIQEETALQIWRKGTLPQILKEANTLDATDCSDIIRLYGCMLEKGAAYVEKSDPMLGKVDKDLKGGFHQKVHAMKTEKDQMRTRRGDTDKGPFASEYRKRNWMNLEEYQIEIPSNVRPAPMVQHPVPSKGYPKQHERDGDRIYYMAPSHGIVFKQAAPDSVLGKIERAFGLYTGAAISGTTADTVHFLNRFAKGGRPDPLFFLLPTATLVHNYHHALVEVGMVLTLQNKPKILDYSIGSYSTLVPRSKHGLRSSLETKLRTFEIKTENRRMLIFWEHDEPAGCFLFEDSEKQLFQDLATADMKLWTTFSGFKGPPTEDDIVGWLKKIPRLRGKVEVALRSRKAKKAYT